MQSLLLKMNNLYYDVSPESYDTISLSYNGVPDEGYDITNLLMTSNLSLSYLFNEITIEGETFNPIDKFNNFSIVSSEKNFINITGIKELNNLLIMNEDLYLDESIYQHINNISCLCEGFVKFVFSLNKGETWNSIVNDETIQLQNTVVLKKFKEMNQLEKNQWVAFANEVSINGFDFSIFDNINFTQYIGEHIRFAILLKEISQNETSSIKNISLNYNELPHLIKVKNSEIEKRLYSNTVQFIPYFNNNYIESRVLTHEFFTNDNGDKRLPLDTPILDLSQTKDTIELQWNNTLYANYYKVYINGFSIITNETNYYYKINKKGIYTFTVRAFTNNKKYKESLFSNGFIVDTLGYISTADNKFITVIKNGIEYKILTKG